jgi:hypothetical protein
MALEDLTGTNKYIANLVNTNPLSADDRREGDDHIRGIKNVLLNTFPGVGGPISFASYVLKAGDTMTGPLTIHPTAGEGQLAIANQGSADFNALHLTQLGNGNATISTVATGSAVRGNLGLDAPNVYSKNMILGGSTPYVANGVVQYINNAGVFTGQVGVGVASGFLDSLGIDVANSTGGIRLATNGVARVEISQNYINIVQGQVYITSADFRLTGNATTANPANLFQDPALGAFWRSTSSARYKTAIEPLEDSSFLYDLNPVTFKSTAEADAGLGRMYGLIAEEVHAVEPAFVSYLDGEPDGVHYATLVVPLIAEVKKLKQRLTELERVIQQQGRAR